MKTCFTPAVGSAVALGAQSPRRSTLLIPALAALAFSMFPVTLEATDWRNPEEGAWSDEENWSNGVPTSAESVSIQQGNAVVSEGTTAAYRGMIVESATEQPMLTLTGGSLSGDDTNLGYQANRSGAALVSGGTWNTGLTFYVGRDGHGDLGVSGGSVSAGTDITLGRTSTAEGTVTLTGGAISASNVFRVGEQGKGTVTGSGGTLAAGAIHLGSGVAGKGYATLQNGTWTVGSFFAGWSGLGDLTFEGGKINATSSTVAHANGSEGTVNMSGGTWTNTGNFTVGGSGTATFNLSSGTVNSGGNETIFLIGRSATANATMTVSGGSLSAHYLDAGQQGRGTLNITGGTVNNVDTFLGEQAGRGVVNVSDGSWTVSQQLAVGYFGTGEVNISGGTVSSGFAALGYQRTEARGNSSGTVTVSGGSWTNAEEIYVGAFGNGTLTISGGTVRAEQGIYAAYGARSESIISVSGNEHRSGVLETAFIERLEGQASLSLNGGTVRALGSHDQFITGYGSGDVVIGSGGVVIDTQRYHIAIDSSLAGVGGITKLGEGSLTLDAVNTMSGTLLIEEGTLIAAQTGALGNASVEVAGGTLHLLAGVSLLHRPFSIKEGAVTMEVVEGTEYGGGGGLQRETADGNTAAGIVQGTSSGDGVLSFSFGTTSSASNDEIRFGDVLHLSGVIEVDPVTGETDLFTLALFAEDFSESLQIGWLDESTNQWVNAVEGNFNGTARFVGDKPYDPLSDFVLGNYGYDSSAQAYWAVLNHNSDFALIAAAIPEPGSFALLGLGGALLFSRQRRRA